jgi:hypothetical protein
VESSKRKASRNSCRILDHGREPKGAVGKTGAVSANEYLEELARQSSAENLSEMLASGFRAVT